MKRNGILLPGLLIWNLTASALYAKEIVEFSIYDEFGDIMFSGPGKLVVNDNKGAFYLEDEDHSEIDLDNFRYRRDTYESAYKQGREALTTYRKNHIQKKVWKFRPLEKEKDKKIIKIEEPQYPALMQNPVPQVMQPGMFGYGSLMMTPGYAYPGMSYPGLVPGSTSPGFTYPFLPFRY